MAELSRKLNLFQRVANSDELAGYNIEDLLQDQKIMK